MYPKASDYLRPVLIFSKYCGIYPGALAPPNLWYYWFAYSTLMLATLLLLTRDILLHAWYSYKDVVYFTFVFSLFIKVFTCFCLISVPIWRQSSYRKLIKSINAAELLMFSFNINQKPNPTKSWQWFSCFACLLLFFLHSILWKQYFGTPFFISIGNFIIHLPLCATFFQCLSFLKLIEDKFSLLNWHMDYLNNKVPAYLTPYERQLFLQNKTRGEHCADKLLDSALATRDVTVQKVRAYNQIHFLLTSASNHLNEYFSMQHLACHLQLGFGVISIAVFICDLRNTYLNTGYVVIFLAPMVYVGSLFFSIAKLCQQIKTVVSIRSSLSPSS